MPRPGFVKFPTDAESYKCEDKVRVSNANAEESYEFWRATCQAGGVEKRVMVKIVNLEKSDEGMLNIVQKEVATACASSLETRQILTVYIEAAPR
jgi:hypothetical protein